jgi:hypothetical protein
MFSYVCLFIVVLLILIISGITFLLILDTQDRNRVSHKIDVFESYIAVLEFHMQKAYEIIYKDKILIYSLEAVKINDMEFNMVSKQFTLLVMKLLGKNLKNEFIELYGDEETFIFNIMEYFNSKFENDEVRERARENILDSEENIP